MDYDQIIKGLLANKEVFHQLLAGLKDDVILWKPQPEKWCLLEIVCHLYDEEREDFRVRTRQVLETPALKLPAIDPQGWVEGRKYMQQNYQVRLNEFLEEIKRSVKWLQSVSEPKWDNAYEHPKFGKMTASMFLSNWLAHDYLHIRQIVKLKFEHLQHMTGEDLSYAGGW